MTGLETCCGELAYHGALRAVSSCPLRPSRRIYDGIDRPSGDLPRARDEFDQWRASGSGRGRIPDRLWRLVVSSLDSFSRSVVSKELRLSAGDRRKRHQAVDARADRNACVELRRTLHKARSISIEPFNGLYKNVFGWGTQMPVKGLRKARPLALGAVFVYQIVLWYQDENNLPLGRGIKALLRAA